MATELEERQQGEGMEVLEQASLPQTPTEPNRWVIVAAGTCLGLLLGVFLAGGREMKDTSLKNLKDVRAYTGLPVLGSVPLVQSDFVAQRKRRLAWLAWSIGLHPGIRHDAWLGLLPLLRDEGEPESRDVRWRET